MSDHLPSILQQMRRDHGNMARLLDVLQAELNRYKVGDTLDFEVVSRIVDYVLNFPDLRHHPREDLVFRYLADRDPASSHRVETILAEHRELAALSRKLSAALGNLQRDVEMPRPWLETLLDSFIARNRDHMRREEELFFPLAMHALTAADWQKIEADMREIFEREGEVLVVVVQERPSIAQIEFAGLHQFEKDQITSAFRQIGIAQGRILDRGLLDRAEQELKRQYLSRGYYAVNVSTTVTPLERNRVSLNFAVEEGRVAKIRQIAIIGAKAFSERELLRLEKETLGLYVSEHPLERVSGQLRRKTDCSLAEIERRHLALRREVEADWNVVETKLDFPVGHIAILAGKYQFDEETKDGLTVRVASFVVKNPQAYKKLRGIAIEEMLHIALVANVKSAIGVAPSFGRPNFPQRSGYFPAGVQLDLLPFGEQALDHFLFLERPEGMDRQDAVEFVATARPRDPVDEHETLPRGQEFATVGHLYRGIADGLHTLSSRLGERGLVAESELVRVAAEAEGRRAEVAAARRGIERLRAQQVATERERPRAPAQAVPRGDDESLGDAGRLVTTHPVSGHRNRPRRRRARLRRRHPWRTQRTDRIQDPRDPF